MQSIGQLINESYYRDNLYSLLVAMRDLGDAPNTGDWFWEIIYFLEEHGANKDGGNVSLNALKRTIYEKVTSQPVLDMLALIDPPPGEGAT